MLAAKFGVTDSPSRENPSCSLTALSTPCCSQGKLFLITRHCKQPQRVKSALNSPQWDWELGCRSQESWSLLTTSSLFIFLTCSLRKHCYLHLKAGSKEILGPTSLLGPSVSSWCFTGALIALQCPLAPHISGSRDWKGIKDG